MKPLFVSSESEPILGDVSGFLQRSGSRFVSSNNTDDSDWACYYAALEVQAFVSRPYDRDHTIVSEECNVFCTPILFHKNNVLSLFIT